MVVDQWPSREETRKEALALLGECQKKLKEARRDYDEALQRCIDAGATNTDIGRAIGRTEAAVRNYIKRRGGR